MAEKFEYTREWTDANAFPMLGFSKSWKNPEDYPTIELDEDKVREDMQSLHDEVKNYINTKLIPAILADDATEEARASAEAARETAEQARASAEGERASAEQARAEAEAGRVSAEAARVTAEQERAAAEQARADENTGIVAQATAQAEAAAASASEAAGYKASAQKYAGDAEYYAQNMRAEVTRAAAYASDASKSATAASASETAAKASETAAAASADAAAASAARAEEVVGGDYATKTDLSAHTGNAGIHVTAEEKAVWDGALPTSGGTMTGDLGVRSGQKISFQEYMAATKAYRDLSSIQFTPATGENFGTYDDGSGFGDTNLKEIILDTEIVKINKTADATPGIHMNGNRIAMVGEPVYREDAATKKYVDSAVGAKAPASKYVTITLSASGWNSTAKTQTVTVTGVSATETAQLITPVPALASQAAYYDAGIKCTGQAANSLTFTADTIPTADLTVYVAIQEVSA